MTSYLREKNVEFYRELLYPRYFRIFIIIYITLKMLSSILHKDLYFQGLQNGLLGILISWSAMYCINLASTSDHKRLKYMPHQEAAEDKVSQQEMVIAKRGLLAAYLYFIFLLLLVIDSLQRRNILAGSPLMSYVLGYDWLLYYFRNASQMVSGAVGFIQAHQVENILRAGIFYIGIPYLLFRLLGYSFQGQFSLRHSRGAWPVLIVTIILFLKNGLHGYWVWNIIYRILYAALGEELFHRGIVFRSASRVLKNSPAALMIGAATPCMVHFPDQFFRIFDGSLTMALANIGDLFLFGLVMSYGYRKTGTLLPWIVIHALFNVMYL